MAQKKMRTPSALNDQMQEKEKVCACEKIPFIERRTMADDLQKKGEMQLLLGDINGLHLFTKAVKLDPLNSLLFYKQGLSLFEYGSEEGKERSLFLALKKLKKATALNPDFFAAWRILGNVFFHIGKTFGEQQFFLQAKEKYRSALSCSEEQSIDDICELHWEMALTWMQIHSYSGEPLDLQLAIESFEKGSALTTFPAEEFYIDFGNACQKLAYLINDVRLFTKAIHCFKQTVQINPNSFKGWFHLAMTLKSLYELTHDEDHFFQSNECFINASKIQDSNKELYLEWARFLCDAGRRFQDTKRLRSSIEKCRKSLASDPNQPLVIATLAEALSTIGELSDRLDLIYEAQNKAAEAVNLARDIPEVWHSYGLILTSFARYFNDMDFYAQAIEKFQCGLSLDRTYYPLWHALAKIYSTVGELGLEREDFILSFRFYQKAIDLNYNSYIAFDMGSALCKFGELFQNDKMLEQGVAHLERLLCSQRNAIYVHPDWLFTYAHALDLLGDVLEDEAYYIKAIEVFSHVMMINPDFPEIHHHLALTYFHLAELKDDIETFYRALHHFRLAAKQEEENDIILLDWGILLINIANRIADPDEIEQLHKEAEHKLSLAAKLGNSHAYYHLGCLYSLLRQNEKAIRYLIKADHFESLPPKDDILQDDWLDNLKNTTDFHDFLSRLDNRSQYPEGLK